MSLRLRDIDSSLADEVNAFNADKHDAVLSNVLWKLEKAFCQVVDENKAVVKPWNYIDMKPCNILYVTILRRKFTALVHRD